MAPEVLVKYGGLPRLVKQCSLCKLSPCLKNNSKCETREERDSMRTWPLQFPGALGMRPKWLRQSWKPSPTGLFTFRLILLPLAALSHCRFRTSLGSVRSASPAGRGCSCCCHHPTTSGTRGLGWHCGPHQVLGSDPTPGPFQPVSGCGHMRGQRELRRGLVTMYAFPSEFKEETVACLPPS